MNSELIRIFELQLIKLYPFTSLWDGLCLWIYL